MLAAAARLQALGQRDEQVEDGAVAEVQTLITNRYDRSADETGPANGKLLRLRASFRRRAVVECADALRQRELDRCEKSGRGLHQGYAETSTAGTLRLVDPKGRGGVRDHVLPVSAAVKAALPLPHPDGGPYIFTTGAKKAIHASTLSPIIAEIATPLTKGRATFSARDIRRTVETRLAAMGVSKEHRAQVLSHGLARGVQEKHYDRHLYLEEKAAALARWEKHLDDLIKAPTPKKGRAKLKLVA